jgi:serine/threonine-protein kinase HipA
MMRDLQSVTVTYHGRKVGTLFAGTKQNCQFEYDKDWLVDGFSISPLKLPLKSGIITADFMPFNGNFGVFEDSLPGGYGEYLLRKVLGRSGINYAALTPVQRLSLVGSSGMGALCYVPESKVSQSDWHGSFDEMQQMALAVLSEKTEDGVDMLFFRSGNSGGVRPKCIYTDTDGHWLVKFRHTYDSKNMGEMEYRFNLVARQCGIIVPDFKLIDGKYFASRRFDIENGQRLHVVTASGLLNEPITPPKMDYHSLLQLTGYLTQSPAEVEQQFRRMAFNVLARNYDDHARNFSFICRDGEWTLAPAYDLTNDNTLGQHATTVNYNGLPTDEDMIIVGTNIRIPRTRCQEIIDEVREGTKELRIK